MCAVRAGGMDAVLREHTPPRAKRCFLVTSLHQQRSYPLARAEALSLRIKKRRWIPAFAGMTDTIATNLPLKRRANAEARLSEMPRRIPTHLRHEDKSANRQETV